jgi:hypothetical protein
MEPRQLFFQAIRFLRARQAPDNKKRHNVTIVAFLNCAISRVSSD